VGDRIASKIIHASDRFHKESESQSNRSSWHRIVLPALLLSYAGQTARLIETPSSESNPFFKLVSN
jgi:K+ potassium transporter